jgi:hypothetical protein
MSSVPAASMTASERDSTWPVTVLVPATPPTRKSRAPSPQGVHEYLYAVDLEKGSLVLEKVMKHFYYDKKNIDDNKEDSFCKNDFEARFKLSQVMNVVLEFEGCAISLEEYNAKLVQRFGGIVEDYFPLRYATPKEVETRNDLAMEALKII